LQIVLRRRSQPGFPAKAQCFAAHFERPCCIPWSRWTPRRQCCIHACRASNDIVPAHQHGTSAMLQVKRVDGKERSTLRSKVPTTMPTAPGCSPMRALAWARADLQIGIQISSHLRFELGPPKLSSTRLIESSQPELALLMLRSCVFCSCEPARPSWPLEATRSR
jgi:hypothetical protein